MDYNSVTLSNSFKIKKDQVRNMQRALGYFTKSHVNKDTLECYIADYDNCYTDDLEVVIDKRTGNVIATFNNGYQTMEDTTEENGADIEDDLKEANIKDEKDMYDIEDFTTVPFAEFIQEALEEGEYVLIKETGTEGLRYSVACGFLITKTSTIWIDVDTIASALLGQNKTYAEVLTKQLQEVYNKDIT